MKKRKTRLNFPRAAALALLAAALPLFARDCRAQEAAAVLSKGTGLYFDAYLSFQKALGRPLQVFDLDAQKAGPPGGLKTAVAFGAKAASFDYPRATSVIALIAPGFAPRAGRAFSIISSFPEPAQAASAYKKLQPALARLAVLYLSPGPAAYLADLTAAGKRLGVEIIPVPLASPDDFPAALRALRARADALWLLPEPALITKTSLSVLTEFSCAGKLPFYAPSSGLAELGAAASFAPDLADTAGAAAAALQRSLAGEKLPPVIYVPRSRLWVNEAFVKKCGLQLNPAAPAEVSR